MGDEKKTNKDKYSSKSASVHFEGKIKWRKKRIF